MRKTGFTMIKSSEKKHAHGREVFGNVNVPMYIPAAKNFPKKVQHFYEADRDNRKRGKQSKVRHPSGYCFTFHDGYHCRGCDFKHECYRCEGLLQVHQKRKKPRGPSRQQEHRLKLPTSRPTSPVMTPSRPITSSLD